MPTLKTRLLPSFTLSSAVPGLPASTVLMVGVPVVSMMPPVPVTPPMVSGTVSIGSPARLSVKVGTVTVKLVTPGASVMVPSPLSVTPALNTGLLV